MDVGLARGSVVLAHAGLLVATFGEMSWKEVQLPAVVQLVVRHTAAYQVRYMREIFFLSSARTEVTVV